MKFLSQLVLISVLAAPLCVFAKDLSFSGEWASAERVTGENKPYSTFTIRLDENETGNIRGAYCFITQSGNRIDCGHGKELNITGRVGDDKKTATVRFYSFFGATDGVASMTVSDDQLIWDVLKQPKGGDYYGPLHSELHKDTSTASHPGERMIVADKAFLYDGPSNKQGSHVYVIKGDYVKLISISSDLQYWKVEFFSKDKYRITKWINCVDIDFCAK